jgi:hypothetical protein
MATHGRITSFAIAVVAGLGTISGASYANDAAQALSDKFSKPATAAAPAKAAKSQSADEAEMLANARREAAERAANATPGQFEQLRKDELARISEKLRKARETRDAKIAAGIVKPAQKPEIQKPEILPWQTEVVATERKSPEFDTSERTALGAAPAKTLLANTRYTIVLSMVPGDRGIRRHNKTADPVLCTHDDGCWISRGLDVAAELVSPRRVYGFSNVMGARAGTCSQALGCVFRGLDLKDPYLQPVDLRVMSHDRRQAQVIRADSACTVVRGQLSCKQPIATTGYTMWIMPEAVANEAGASALQRLAAAGQALQAPRDVTWRPIGH